MPMQKRFIVTIHAATLLCGAGLCIGGSDGTGVLLLCVSAVFLAVLCVANLESVVSSAGTDHAAQALSSAQRAVTIMTKRRTVVAELLRCIEHAPIDPRLSWVLDNMDSDDTRVDIVLHALRDDMLSRKRTA
jgi:hypothetical protein